MSDTSSSDVPPHHRAGRSCLKMVMILGLGGLVIVLLLGAAAAVAAYVYITAPGIPGETVRVTIPEGATGSGAGKILAESGLVMHPLLFRAAIHLDRSGKPIKHGRYDLPQGLSPVELLELLRAGPNTPLAPDEIPDELKPTIPEGLTIKQMAWLFGNPDAFLKAAASQDLRDRLGIAAPSLEGFLMPNTYYFAEKPTEREVVERMVEEFEHVYDSLSAELPAPPGFDQSQIVTIASLVEEEARLDEERPLVAAVIYSRVKEDMPLDLDCTLQYALGKYGQRLLDEDKEVDSPYNTYIHKGLPPGPVSNPGRASLRAAFQPSDEPYLYFVSNADGKSHTFSKTFAEHTRAVARYRKEISVQRKQLEQENNEKENPADNG